MKTRKTLCLQSAQVGPVQAIDALENVLSRFATFCPATTTAARMMACVIVDSEGPAAVYVVSRTSHTKVALVHEGDLRFRIFADFGPGGSKRRAENVVLDLLAAGVKSLSCIKA